MQLIMKLEKGLPFSENHNIYASFYLCHVLSECRWPWLSTDYFAVLSELPCILKNIIEYYPLHSLRF